MLYFIDLHDDLNEEIKDLANIHADGDVSKFIKLLALQACCPEAVQDIYGNHEDEQDVNSHDDD